jgi:D-beta-D-heptose 7-phosphate kinase/D-beta-D-heptose 1-phosphate adenosyltransferase
MVKLTRAFSRLNACKVLVAGDFLLDAYTIGKARRISPEAPVAVVQVKQEEKRPGGAGNVALNLISMGCKVAALGRVGSDHHGECLTQILRNEGVDVSGLQIQNGYSTPVKNRIIADNQQIVRIDFEEITALPEQLEQHIIEHLPTFLDQVQIIALSDYGKGFSSKILISALIEQARMKGIPVIADPKGMDFAKYSGATVLKPNLSEVYQAAKLPAEASLDQVAAKVLQMADAEVLMVTRSEEGISLFHKSGSRQDFPVKAREVKDVTGAGDTVLAMLACAMGCGLSLPEATQLSNVAAGIAIERFGCARVTLSDVARRLLESDVSNKIFDDEHLFALQEILKGQSFSLLAISSSQGFSSHLFQHIRQLSLSKKGEILIYVKDQNPSEEFIDLLAALHDVNFIIIKASSLQRLCQNIAPCRIFDFHNQSLQELFSINALLT